MKPSEPQGRNNNSEARHIGVSLPKLPEILSIVSETVEYYLFYFHAYAW